ncbi:MAG: flagellin [Bryobacteraceae bacterium]|jgi:flagellin
MLSIQTNVNSLIAQENLNVNNEFQSRTIQQLTSGYRINSSGDDAAGLAVANQYRNSVAELTQGVSNGNDGVAQLQIMDGGMSNISQILDRLKTLATEAASGTFTGNLGVLNQEFQTDIGEIDRQAQTIGLNTGGSFAKSLGVYLGGGAGSTAASALQNGVVTVNLSNSTVDSQSLGLTGVQSGNTGYDLSTSNIVAIKGNGSNTTVSPGTTQFQIYGPGFGSGVDVNVATSAITDGASLVTAINQAIASAGVSNTAFASAGITASMTTDATTQHQVLSFSSAGSAFQVRAGDRMANAFLGNTGANGLGTALAATLTGNAYNGTTFTAGDSLNITVQGAGLSAPVSFSQTANTGAGSAASTAVLIQNDVAANTALAAAGITVSNTAGHLDFTSASGGAVSVMITGDTQNVLGYGSFVGTAPATSITAGGAFAQSSADGTVDLDLSLGDGSQNSVYTLTTLAISMPSASNATADQAVGTINAQIAGLASNNAFKQAGIMAVNNGGSIELTSTNGTDFRLGVRNDGTNTSALGFYAAAARNASGLAAAYSAPATPTASFVNQDAKGEYQLGTTNAGVGTAAPLSFTPVIFGDDTQSLTVSAADASGASHSVVVSLNQANGQNIDQAISAINSAIHGSGDSTLMQINAVKVNVTGTQKIEFESTVPNFSVNVGSTTNGSGVGSQGSTLSSVKVGTGGAADISTLAGAQAAVTAVTAAVAALGVAQAAVGKGENQLNYAVALAQSQISNLSSAESNIRDADVAQQAANLTKAQVLQQASIAAMAQANSAPQAVLSLLKT